MRRGFHADETIRKGLQAMRDFHWPESEDKRGDFLSGKKTRDASWYAGIEGRKEIQFVNYDFTPEEKVTFKAWRKTADKDVWDAMVRLNESGYSMSCKYDLRGECFAAFITCVKEESPNFGWVLPGRGSTPLSAVMGAMFRHWQLFDEQWPTGTARRFSVDDE